VRVLATKLGTGTQEKNGMHNEPTAGKRAGTG
jgi:hypothetical protein